MVQPATWPYRGACTALCWECACCCWAGLQCLVAAKNADMPQLSQSPEKTAPSAHAAAEPVSQKPLLLVLQAAEGRTAKRRKGPTGAAIPAEDAGPPAEDAADARADAVEVTCARLLCNRHAMWTLTCCLGWSCTSGPSDCLCSSKPRLLCICSPWWAYWSFSSLSESKALPAVTV